MTTIASDPTALVVAALATIPNPPKSHCVYYTCFPESYGYTCEAGQSAGIWVGICKYQPESWHQKALSKRLGVRESDVKILENASVKK